MTEWYRNTDWTPEIAEAFETKLSRARDYSKPQYLQIQGMILVESHPKVAISLLERCAAMSDPVYVAGALLYAGMGYAYLGDVPKALTTLQACVAQEEREPKYGTTARIDYAFLVALFEYVDHYDAAFAALEKALPFLPIHEFQIDLAYAVILNARGETAAARDAASRAVMSAVVREGWIPRFPKVGVVPANAAPLLDRLEAILR